MASKNLDQQRDEAAWRLKLERRRLRSAPQRRAEIASFDVNREIRHIVGRAQEGDSRVVSLGMLIFFSTATGDAWMLDVEDRHAHCLARDGEQQPFTVMKTGDQVAIQWDAGFVIDGDRFVVIHRSGEVRTIVGYPTDEIAARCRQASGGGPLPGLASIEVGPVDGEGRVGGPDGGEGADATLDQTTPRPPEEPELTTSRRAELDLDQPLEMAVLKLGKGMARCRPLGADLELTLRAPDVLGLVPGEIVTVRGRKQWRRAGQLYLTGNVVDHRLEAAALGLTPLGLRMEALWDPAKEQWTGTCDRLEDWERTIAEHGPRGSFCLEMVTPLHGRSDDDGPILRAVQRSSRGDVEGARRILMDLLAADLRYLDAHAHLGNLVLDDWPAEAIRHYTAGVEIGDLSLPEDFSGLLPWGRIPNRPFLRCVHGYGLCLWRLGRSDEAREVFERMLWLNPLDNQGARFLLSAIRDGQRWQDLESGGRA